jgi:FKBP-type peptidyl-prolyl cis-trans isomerase FkpA
MRVSVFRSIRTAAAVASLLAGLVGVQACGDNPLKPSDFGIEVTDLVVGSGSEARIGRGVTVHYTLWLLDDNQPERKGQQIETTVGGQPFSFALGYGQVIRGWDIGIPGMKVGGKRRLIIPPGQAYGSAARGEIPPNSTLVFDIDLLGLF